MLWIDISTLKHQLKLYDGHHLVKKYPIAVGRMVTATPMGTYRIINKQRNPGGPFGVFWMGYQNPIMVYTGQIIPLQLGEVCRMDVSG